MEQQSSDVPFSRLNCIDTLTQYIQKIPVNGNVYKRYKKSLEKVVAQ